MLAAHGRSAPRHACALHRPPVAPAQQPLTASTPPQTLLAASQALTNPHPLSISRSCPQHSSDASGKMSKAPIEISSKEQFKDILKKSRVVVADCEFHALSTRLAWTTPASERRPRAQIRSRPEGLRLFEAASRSPTCLRGTLLQVLQQANMLGIQFTPTGVGLASRSRRTSNPSRSLCPVKTSSRLSRSTVTTTRTSPPNTA